MDHGEKIAVLEEKIKQVESVQKQILDKQDQLFAQLTRYKGFIGGVFFVFSTLGTAWMFFGEWIKMKTGLK